MKWIIFYLNSKNYINVNPVKNNLKVQGQSDQSVA